MAIKVFTYSTASLWSDHEMQLAYAAMPQNVRARIMTYKSPQARQSRLSARMLLAEMLRSLNIPLTIADVKVGPSHKPYLDFDFDFSITHTDGLVACAGSRQGPIGLDAECDKPIDLEDYTDSLTTGEKHAITATPQTLSFWDIWTRKEAMAKASGLGIEMDWQAVDVSSDAVALEGRIYQLHRLNLGANIIAHLAVSEFIPPKYLDIEIIHLDTARLLTTD